MNKKTSKKATNITNEKNKKDKLNKKVMFVCNSGGHLTEMFQLEKVIKKYDYLIVTEDTKISKDILTKSKFKNVKYVKYMSRKNMITYVVKGVINIFKAVIDIIKFNPKVIVSTGACVGAIYLTIGKILGKKIIYIESIARVNTLSGTGKFVYKFADEFFVEWEYLKDKYSKVKVLRRF